MGYLSLQRDYFGLRQGKFHMGQRRGLGVAASPDGIRWQPIKSWATESICDGGTHWMWDQATGKYLPCGVAHLHSTRWHNYLTLRQADDRVQALEQPNWKTLLEPRMLRVIVDYPPGGIGIHGEDEYRIADVNSVFVFIFGQAAGQESCRRLQCILMGKFYPI